MQLSLIVIGTKMPDWIQTGITHYQKQLPPALNFRLITLEAQKRTHKNKSIAQIKILEGNLLLKASQGAHQRIALDENGVQQSTQSIANSMQNWRQNGNRIALLMGGADGLSPECKAQCAQLWGLSKLTLPHSMARLLMVEQIYRAHSLLQNHPYHRA